jgi:hypothetical protein
LDILTIIYLGICALLLVPQLVLQGEDRFSKYTSRCFAVLMVLFAMWSVWFLYFDWGFVLLSGGEKLIYTVAILMPLVYMTIFRLGLHKKTAR